MPQTIQQFNLPHTRNRGLGVFAVAMVNTPKTDKNCHFCMVMSPQTICVDLSCASNKNDSQLYLPHTHNCGLGVIYRCYGTYHPKNVRFLAISAKTL